VKNFPPPPPPRGHTLQGWMQRNNEAGWHLTRGRDRQHDQPAAEPDIERGRRNSGWRHASALAVVGGLFVVVVGIGFGALTTALLLSPAKPIAIITGPVTLALAVWGRNLLRGD
jgi:hypothetical protein